MTPARTVFPKRPRRIPAFRFVLAIACAAAFCGIAAAQGGGWAAVGGISPGSRVEIRLSPRGTVKGMLVSVSGSAMDLQKSNGSIRHVARAQIAKVYLVGKSHGLRGGLIGAGVGSAGGVILGLTVYNGGACCTDYYPNSQPHPVSKAAATALYGAAIGAVGAVIGAIIGSHHSKTLVYEHEARPSRKPPSGQSQRPLKSTPGT